MDEEKLRLLILDELLNLTKRIVNPDEIPVDFQIEKDFEIEIRKEISARLEAAVISRIKELRGEDWKPLPGFY